MRDIFSIPADGKLFHALLRYAVVFAKCLRKSFNIVDNYAGFLHHIFRYVNQSNRIVFL